MHETRGGACMRLEEGSHETRGGVGMRLEEGQA